MDFEERWRRMRIEADRKQDEKKIVGRMSYLKTWEREFIVRGHRYVFCEVLEVFCREPDRAERFKARTPEGRIAYFECAMGHFMERDRNLDGEFDGDAFMNGEGEYYL